MEENIKNLYEENINALTDLLSVDSTKDGSDHNPNCLNDVIVMPGMSDNSVYTTSSGENRGWYYDFQLRNAAMSARLFANSYVKTVDKDGRQEWEYIRSKGGENQYTVLLVSSILNEDFQIDVSNSWDDTGSEVISGILNGMVKPYAPYATKVSDLLKAARDYNSTLDRDIAAGEQEGATETQVAAKNKAEEIRNTFVGKALDKLSGSVIPDITDGLAELSQGVFVSQGAAFTTYGGTGVNFGGLGMKFTLFPTWRDGELVSVIEQVYKLIPYSIGNLETLNWEKAADIAEKGADAISKKTNMDLITLYKNMRNSTAGKAVIDSLNKYIKWQRPPGGYNVNDPLNVDVEHFPGTLRLEIGTHYLVDNLVISGMSLQFSKQMVKDPTFFLSSTTGKHNIENAKGLSPLYCEVNLLLRPVTKYSQTSMVKFIEGNTERRAEIVSGMQTNLKKIRESISGRDSNNSLRY